MADKGYESLLGGESFCWYNNSDACSFALAIGVLSFLICIVFVVKDIIMVVVDFSGALLVSTRCLYLR